jgi:hypothetical protein
MRKTVLVFAVLIAAAAALPLGAVNERIDYEGINKIKQQGLSPQNSQVMEISSWLTDVYGPRLTGSPNVQKAGDWAVSKMKEWGLQNVALEPWPNRNGFDRGWVNEKFTSPPSLRKRFPYREHRPRGRLARTASCAVRWCSSRKPRRKISRSTRAS